MGGMQNGRLMQIEWEASEELYNSLPGCVVMGFDLVLDVPVEQIEDVPFTRPDWLLNFRYEQALPPRCRSTRNMWKWVTLLNLALATWSGLTSTSLERPVVTDSVCNSFQIGTCTLL